MMLLLLTTTLTMLGLFFYGAYKKRHPYFIYRAKLKYKGQSKSVNTVSFAQNQPKPKWVVDEVIRLKAIMGDKVGCRKVADTFNRLHGDRQTVGKSFVAKTIRKHRY